MTDEELKKLVAETAASVDRLSAEHAKTEEALRRTDETLRRLDEKTSRHLRQVGSQIGGLGNKFGGYTEGLAVGSLEKILRERFGADVISQRVKARKRGRHQEFDLVALRNGSHNEVYVVEIKSELNEIELSKSLKKLREFFDFMPQYRGMKLYGIISAVDVRGALAERVLHEGIYLATASDENFKLVKPPSGFKPKVFTAR